MGHLEPFLFFHLRLRLVLTRRAIQKSGYSAELDELKAEEYRYWQSRPAHERIDAVSDLTQALYALKGEAPDVPRLHRTIARFERAQC